MAAMNENTNIYEQEVVPKVSTDKDEMKQYQWKSWR